MSTHQLSMTNTTTRKGDSYNMVSVPYDEERVEITRQKLSKFEFTSCVDSIIKSFVYVIPNNLKLVRMTKHAKEHKRHLSCMQCLSTLSPHPLNKICKMCKKACCNQCFIDWTKTATALEFAFPCLCDPDNCEVCSITDYDNFVSLLMPFKLSCPFKSCSFALTYADFYRGYDSTDRNRGSSFYGQEGREGLGSWPLPDSHFYVCDCKPIECDKCSKKLQEKEWYYHRSNCHGTDSKPTTGKATNVLSNPAIKDEFTDKP